jgi:hypothetical protein
MSRSAAKLLKSAATLAMMLVFWLAAGEKAQAGCGDHGYVVQRDNGKLLVVTPSNSGCPCKGPACKKQSKTQIPFTPSVSIIIVPDAWQQVAAPANCNGLIALLWPPSFSLPVTGFAYSIFHPPRA